MKRVTLTLTALPLRLKFDHRILGRIDHVLEKLGEKASPENVLVDLSSFRSFSGKYHVETCEGVRNHIQTLDTLHDQSGTLILRPGEYVSFEIEGSYVLAYNKPDESGAPYLHNGIFRDRMQAGVAKELKAIRNQHQN